MRAHGGARARVATTFCSFFYRRQETRRHVPQNVCTWGANMRGYPPKVLRSGQSFLGSLQEPPACRPSSRPASIIKIATNIPYIFLKLSFRAIHIQPAFFFFFFLQHFCFSRTKCHPFTYKFFPLHHWDKNFRRRLLVLVVITRGYFFISKATTNQ